MQKNYLKILDTDLEEEKNRGFYFPRADLVEDSVELGLR